MLFVNWLFIWKYLFKNHIFISTNFKIYPNILTNLVLKWYPKLKMLKICSWFYFRNIIAKNLLLLVSFLKIKAILGIFLIFQMFTKCFINYGKEI